MTREESLLKIGELVVYARANGWDDVYTEAFKVLEHPPCEDAISRQMMLNTEYQIKEINGIEYVMLSEVQMKIRKMPPVNSQEPKMGYWIDADGDNAICGCCNRLNHLYGTYCKHCGAKMESEEV